MDAVRTRERAPIGREFRAHGDVSSGENLRSEDALRMSHDGAARGRFRRAAEAVAGALFYGSLGAVARGVAAAFAANAARYFLSTLSSAACSVRNESP
jgi:hypothetical protein